MSILSEAININSGKIFKKSIHTLEFYSYTLDFILIYFYSYTVREEFELTYILDSK